MAINRDNGRIRDKQDGEVIMILKNGEPFVVNLGGAWVKRRTRLGTMEE